MLKNRSAGTQNPENNGSDTETASKPMSVRESIESAMREQDDSNNDEEKKRPKVSVSATLDDLEDEPEDEGDEKPKKPAKKPEPKEDEEEETEDDTEELDEKEEETEEELVDKTKTPKVEKSTYTAPVGWTKEAKAEFNKLPEAVKASIAKREKEVSEGFATYGARVKQYEELDRVIGKRAQQIQAAGRTPAETVERLFGWMEALSTRDPSAKLNAFKSLAQSFGIDVAQAFQQPTQQQNDDGNQNPAPQNGMDPQLQNILQEVVNRISGFEEQTAAQKREASNQHLMNWAKDKPHFERVRQSMYALLSSGTIPLSNGSLDLDAAYQKAIRLDDELFSETQAQEAEAKAARIAAKKAKLAQQNQAAIGKARVAGSSLKPQSKNAMPSPANQKKPARNETVRESIARAIKEQSN